ncbi:MAG: Ig-like domain-containing protein [Anaerolineales bacterium]|nr:Ig-like domain-containing protein [Anaerolineales bacterium]
MKRMLLFIALFGMLAVVASDRALSQDSMNPPPRVIDVWPLPGVELLPDDTLSITFNQAMDQDSVAKALSFEPSLDGSLTWVDGRSVNFVPTGGWPRNTSYSLTIGTNAQTPDGIGLEETYTATLKTISPLEVTTVVPDVGAEGVAADASIVVTFNRPVVPLVSTEQFEDLPQPIQIEPELAGSGEWLNTGIYIFTPAEPLRGGTIYTVTVQSGLTAVDGAVLEADYGWSFKTLPPQVTSVYPRDRAGFIYLDDVINVYFSQPMDKTSTEAAFSLWHNGAAVAGSFEWGDTHASFLFRPTELLTIDSSYILNITDSAMSAYGDATLDAGISYTFSTVPYPAVDTVSPYDGNTGVRPGGGASIRFRTRMDTETFVDKIEVSPDVEWEPVVYGEQSLGISFRSQPNTQYTITLKRGTEDIYGNAIATDYTFRFTTGELQSSLYPILESGSPSLLQTGAYREDTRISLSISGKPQAQFILYRIQGNRLPEVAGNLTSNYPYSFSELPAWLSWFEIARTWTTNFNSDGAQNIPTEVFLASEEGGALTPGVYWLAFRDTSRDDNRYYQYSLAVVNATATVKRSPQETMVWVTDMPSAAPIQEATVTIYNKGEAIARGQTNAEGIFRAPIDLVDDEQIFVVIEGAGAYGVWYSTSDNDLPIIQDYLYTDRPIYRPGETVYYRGVLREREDMDYGIPNVRQVPVQITATDGTTLFEGNAEVTDFGTFSGELLLPEETALGNATIYANGRYLGSFTIAEFRVPEFAVSATPQQDEIFQGDPLNVLVSADYYSGGKVSNADVSWSATAAPAGFVYTGNGRYRFYDETTTATTYTVGNGTGRTDADGNYLISSTNTQTNSNRPVRLTVTATVTDESYQSISSSTSVLAHPANIYVGLQSSQYFGRENQPMPIDLIAVTADSTPIADKTITLEVVEIRWERTPIEGQFGRYEWNQEEIAVETLTITTDANGLASYTFTPPNAGIFRVRASALDEYERPNSSTLRFWVTGTRRVWWGQASTRIQPVADKDSYQLGDTAQILVPLPFEGASTVLITTERAGVIAYEVRQVEGSTLLYDLPISEAHVPTVHVSFTAVKGIDGESLNPDYRTGSIALAVEPTQQRLHITVTPSASLTQPRDTLSFELTITDADGNPVQAEIGLALTDKAILALAPPNSGTLEGAYYGYQRDYVYTGISLQALLDRVTDTAVPPEEDKGGTEELGTPTALPTMTAMAAEAPAPTAGDSPGGAAQPPNVTVRENFEQTPLWEGHVVTDANGKATVSLELPDNLTTWTFDARALTTQTQVGQTTIEVVTTLPLLVRPATPRFMVVGDRVQLAMVVNNNTEAAQDIEAYIQAAGVELEGDSQQTVTIEAGSRARISWWATVQDVEYVDLTFIAVGQDGYQDAAKPSLATGPDGTIPVYRYTAPDKVGTAGILREGGADVEGISLPPRFDDREGELVIRTDPSLAVTTIDSLNYLENYPHQCIEQTVSRFLPNAVTYRALASLGVQDSNLEANLYVALNYGMTRLQNEQNPDGGWGWFVRMESNPMVSAYAVLGLIEAQESGWEVDSGMMDSAMNYLRGQLTRPTIDSQQWQLNRQAFFLYVLARAGEGNLDDYQRLYELRLKLSYASRAYLLLAYQERFPTEAAINDLISDLTTAAILSATGAHWEEEYVDWWNWGSNTRTTAIVLSALIHAQPESDLLPNAVRWLMVARNGDHWESTQETVWTVLALTDWMLLTGELQGDYDYQVNLNNEGLLDESVTPDTVREGHVLRIAVRDLLADEMNRLIVAREDGMGALYYTAHLDLRLPASEVDALNRGVQIERQYFLANDPAAPITSAKVGDTITVKLTFTLTEDMYYFVLEDPYPAGTEAVNSRLLTTASDGRPQLNRFSDEWRWWWGWWWYDRTELRDEQANLYADYLPRGTYVFSYQVNATVPGEFQTRPAQGYAFYFPEVFGRSDGALFTVTE